MGNEDTTILVVDDDRGLLRLVERALQREGYTAARAGSGKEALRWLATHEPDLILLDLKLQDVAGVDLVQRLSEIERRIPFIIITGQGDERVAVEMMKLGALDYLVKDADFLATVGSVTRRALARVERDRKLAEAEAALRRREANLAKAQAISHIGSYEVNIPFSSNDYRSEEVYRILGIERPHGEFSTEEYIERFVHPADRGRYRGVLEQAELDAAPFDFEYRIIRPDGAIRHVQSVGEPVIDGSGKVVRFVGTLLDITLRRRWDMRQNVQYAITRALGESGTLAEASPSILQAIVEGLGWDAGELWSVDVEAQVLRSVDAWLPAGTELGELVAKGHKLSFARGTGLPGRVWATAQPAWVSDLGRDPNFRRAVLARKLGLQSAFAFPILLGDEVLGVMAFFSRARRDPEADLLQLGGALGSQIGQFAERKRAEEALRKEHAFSGAILDMSGALVTVLDREGRIVRFNRACEETTGYTFEEVRGRPFWEMLIVAEELDSVRAVFRKLRSGQFPNQHENHWLARDGMRRLIAWSNTALVDTAGQVEFVVATGIDITERKRLEKEILEISDREQRRLGQDLHDGLCQHLAATELMGQVLEQRLQAKCPEAAGGASEIARHVREAISQTRLLARGLSPLSLEAEGLQSALQELVLNTEQMFRVTCRLEIEGVVRVRDHAAATHLFRIAQEAVSNALKHSKASRVTIRLASSAQHAILTITDNGVGMPAKPRKTGMGLRIMNYRAGMIGATLRTESARGKGTSVVCTFRKNL